MKNWWIVVSAFYTLAVIFLITPLVWNFALPEPTFYELSPDPLFWIWVAILVGGQAVLLFLSVDSSRRILRPRQHILISIGIVAILVALLTQAAVYSLLAGISEDTGMAVVGGDSDIRVHVKVLALLLALWVFWGSVFYLYARRTSIAVDRMVAWLLRGSVLELLIAVPSHVLVRRRDDCCAPMLTGFGIATGIAIMLLSFGPSVLFLYMKRLERYGKRDVDRNG